MGKKLKNYVLYLEALLADRSKIEDIEKLKHDILLEIGFWQHERLIHLLIIFAVTYVDDNSKLFLCDYSIACTDLIAFVLRDSIYSSLLYIRK